MNNYWTEAYNRYGQTKEYLEYSEKTKNHSKEKQSHINAGLMIIFSKFAACRSSKKTAGSPQVQVLVEELSKYITQNYYTCTKEILACLGKMYVSDERFKNNIDKYAEGTAEFASKAIEIFCK